ncbi:hypothetical protein ACFW04_003838 [Cataglyphis niger]
MAVRHRIQWLIIHIVYCVAIVQSTLLDINDAESCDLLCAQCNASAVFAHDRCECNSSDNNDKEVECIQRIQREIQTIDLNTLSEDLTDEERAVRSIITSRRRLRMEAGPCVHPVVSSVETPIVGMINPALSYPANEVYATNPLVGSIIHPYRHGLSTHHTLHRFPGQILSNLFGHRRAVYHHPVYHGGFIRSSNNINPVSAGQSTGENDSSATFKDFPIARSNTDKTIDQNIVENPTYMLNANPVYPPRQYQLFSAPYQYTSYHNPLINVLHPVTDGYIVQPEYIPQYIHDTSDPLISALNPNSYCTNNINAEQKNEVSTVNVHSNNEAEQSNNAIKNKEDNKIKKNENKS